MPATARANPHPEIGNELVRDWAPEGEPRVYVVLVHGLGEHSGRYARTGDLLAGAGYHVRSFDLIGAGGSGGRRWDIDEWSRYHDQIGTHVQWARSHGAPVVLMGHSMGGALALGYALSDRPRPDLLVLSAPALSGGAGWQRALAPIAGKLAPTLSLANNVKGEHLSRDPAVGEAYMADPLVSTKSTCRLGARLFEEMDRLSRQLGELDIPTLVIHGGEDRLVPTVSSEPLAAIDCVDRKVYDGLRHETLNEPEGPQVVSDIVEWVDRETGNLR
jgi:alpha-beta hydrolase superfamily lysophospholipase